MQKILSLVLSLIGNIGILVVVLIGFFVMGIGIITGDIDPTTAYVCASLAIVFFIIAEIGNKMQDAAAWGLNVKIKLFKLIGWIPNIAGMVAGILGAFVIIIGAILGYDPTIVEGIIPVESVTEYKLCIFGGYLLVCGAAWATLFGGYIIRHCKHCGANLKGASYSYEEVERMFRSTSNDTKLTSKIRFEFDCPECGETTVFFKKLKTDAESVDKYARKIAGR